MSGVVEFVGRVGMRVAAAALLRAAIRLMWPRLRSAVVGLGFAALVRKFWTTAVALLAIAAIVVGMAVAALCGHKAEVQAASAKVQQTQLAEEATDLDGALATLQAAAQTIRQPKHAKNASRKQAAAAQALELNPLGEESALTPAEIDHRRELLQKLAAKTGAKVEVPGKPSFRMDPVIVARAEQFENVPKRSALPVGIVALAWLLLTVVRKSAKHLALMVFPVKALGVAALVVAGLMGGVGIAMQRFGLTFAVGAIAMLVAGATCCGWMARRGGQQ